MNFKPHPYQQRAIKWICDHNHCALFLDMGLGKTVITLTAFDLLRTLGEAERALIIAPARVADGTWSAEVAKWAHLSGLTIGEAVGTPLQRKKVIDADPDILVVSRENFYNFVREYGVGWKWDYVVIDELSGFKHQGTKRFKAFKTMRKFFPRIVGLTGTPASNGYTDLWGQMFCIDGGERLGKTEGRYHEEYFYVYRHNNVPIRFTLKPRSKEVIQEKISDIALAMRAEDWLALPPVNYIDYQVKLSPDMIRQYRIMERDHILTEIGESKEISAESAAAVASKLSQIANGFVYEDMSSEGIAEPVARELHQHKIDALRDIMDATEEPVLVFYQYRADKEMIMREFETYHPCEYTGKATLDLWNEGRIRLLLAHPASCSYGLNLQHGGRYIVWYSTGYNLEQYEQANARLHRQGQTRPVTIYHLISQGTIDEKMLAALQGKCTMQNALMDALKRIVR